MKSAETRRRSRWHIGVLFFFVIALGCASGAWFLLKPKPIEALYGGYPPDTADFTPGTVNPRRHRDPMWC
jgi:hypothetical protein